MRYAEIKDGICINIVEADEIFARLMKLVELPDGYGIGDYCTDGIWSHEAPEPIEPEPSPDGDQTNEQAIWDAMAQAYNEGVQGA